MKPATTVQEVVELYEQFGADHYDEALSQLDHAVQTAALADAAGAPGALVAAALLHDVGHLVALAEGTVEVGGEGGAVPEDLRHEAVGARYLGRLFTVQVTTPIALHVRAKRYRCAVEPKLLMTLSAASVSSLERQGGPLSADEARAFEAVPGFADAVALRTWDDLGKIEGLRVDPFEQYLELLEDLAAGSTSD